MMIEGYCRKRLAPLRNSLLWPGENAWENEREVRQTSATPALVAENSFLLSATREAGWWPRSKCSITEFINLIYNVSFKPIISLNFCGIYINSQEQLFNCTQYILHYPPFFKKNKKIKFLHVCVSTSELLVRFPLYKFAILALIFETSPPEVLSPCHAASLPPFTVLFLRVCILN